MTGQTSEASFATPNGTAVAGWSGLLRTHHWLPFVLPFAVFMASGLLEPRVPRSATPAEGNVASDSPATNVPQDAITDQATLLSYPAAYAVRFGLTLVAVLLVLPAWRTIPLRVGWLAVIVGLLGGLLWIFICRLRLEDQFFTLIGRSQWAVWGDRAAFDPFAYYGDAVGWMAAFLAVRFAALTVLVPLIEEFFLRGFFMRFVMQAHWWTIPLGTVTWGSGAAVVAYAVLSHPAEPIAGALWFTLITLLYARTRSLWDCVVAHGVTNAMLGVYVMVWRDWTLW